MKQCWKYDFEETKKRYKNINNLLDSFKEKHENINHLYEWTMGIFIAIFLSISLGNLTQSQNKFLYNLGFWGYIISGALLVISIILYTALRKRQRYIISNLYEEKDKQEANQKKKK